MLVNIKVTGGLNIESGHIDPKATGGWNIESGQIDPKATQGLILPLNSLLKSNTIKLLERKLFIVCTFDSSNNVKAQEAVQITHTCIFKDPLIDLGTSSAVRTLPSVPVHPCLKGQRLPGLTLHPAVSGCKHSPNSPQRIALGLSHKSLAW